MASETTPLTSYGSVPTTVETVEQGTGFQEGSVYYLKEKSLTPKEKFQKLVRVAVPLAIALLVLGGFAYFLTRGFDSLYPAPGEPSHVNIPHFTPSTDTAASPPGPSPLQPYGPPIPSPVSTPVTSSSSASSSTGGGSSDSDCSAHPKCNDLGLTGSCCPTGEGVVLGCC